MCSVMRIHCVVTGTCNLLSLLSYNMRALHLLHVVVRFQPDGVHVGVHAFVCVLYLPHHHYVPCVLCFHFHVM